MKSHPNNPQKSLVLNIHKPAGWTSFDVVKKVRRLLGEKKVGHAGTLDPFATGVLVVCTGRLTKKISSIMSQPKEYVAEIALGKETDTLDTTGEVIAEKPVPPLSEEIINAALQKFVGEIEQEIPAYSAKKFRGKRLYALARKGQEVPRLTKKVHIHEIELLDWTSDMLRIRVVCGSGTYIRMLARDIARELSTVGYLKSLVRTRVGKFTIEEAISIDELPQRLPVEEK